MITAVPAEGAADPKTTDPLVNATLITPLPPDTGTCRLVMVTGVEVVLES